MSLSISTRYGSRANDPTLDYPTGSFKNKTAPDALDGTPLEKDWANDLLGARDAILAEAGILANGVADTAQASQLLAALQTLGLRAATETQAGVLEIATTAEAQAFTAGKVIDGAKLASVTATETRAGLIEIATTAETQTGTDAVRAVTPAGLKSIITASATDTTEGRVVKTGDFGLGTAAVFPEGTDCNTTVVGGVYNIGSAVNAPAGLLAGEWIHLEVIRHPNGTDFVFQRVQGLYSQRSWQRWRTEGTWGAWQEIYTTGSLGVATETTAGLIEIATTAEAQALVNDTHALTPAKLAAAFDGLPAVSVEPGDFVIMADVSDTGKLKKTAAGGFSFPSGTVIPFYQASAPTGWTKLTAAALNDAVLRIVTGAAGVTGGSTAFSTFNAQTAVGATTLSTAQMPSHSHSTLSTLDGSSSSGGASLQGSGFAGTSYYGTTGAGSGGWHTHSITTNIKYADFIVASKD